MFQEKRNRYPLLDVEHVKHGYANIFLTDYLGIGQQKILEGRVTRFLSRVSLKDCFSERLQVASGKSFDAHNPQALYPALWTPGKIMGAVY